VRNQALSRELSEAPEHRRLEAVVLGIVGIVPNGAERFFGQTGGSLREMPILIPNRQGVDEVFNPRHPFGRKASNLLEQGFFSHCVPWVSL
jgi:hypothetical protein